MGGALLEKITEDIEKNLGEYKDLVAKRMEIEQRLDRARDEKESVKEAIYERVCDEYSSQIETIEESVEPVRERVNKIRQEINDGRSDLSNQIKSAEDEVEEVDFRRRVGEYSDDEHREMKKPLKDRIDDLVKQEKEFNRLIGRIDAAERGSEEDDSLNAMADPEPASLRAADSDSKPPAKSDDNAEDEQRVDSSPSEAAHSNSVPSSSPKSISNSNTDLSDKHTRDDKPAQTGPAKTDGVIDTSGWADELQSEDSGPAPDKSVHFRGRRSDDKSSDKDHDDSVTDSESAEGPPPRNDENGFPNLIIIKGAGAGKKLPLVPVTMTIGREHDNNIELKDEEVARYHARVSFMSGSYHIEDLESSSGTWINGERITEVKLKHGDKIKVGRTELLIDFD